MRSHMNRLRYWNDSNKYPRHIKSTIWEQLSYNPIRLIVDEEFMDAGIES